MDTTPNIAPTAPTTPEAPAAPAAPAAKACPKKKGCGAIILLLVLLVLAGAGASVFFYLDNHNQSQEITKLKNTISTYESSQKESAVDKAMIQNLLDPYAVSFGPYYSVFETGLTEDAKATIALLNINYQFLGTQKNTETNFEDFTVYYPQVNSKYKQLFGSNKDLAERSFSSNKFNQLKYDNGQFTVSPAAFGGSGAYTINKIKDFSISTDVIEVEMYHDNVPFCDLVAETVAEDEIEGKTYCVDHLDDEGIDKFLESHMEEMPVYTLKFEKDTGYEYYEYKDGRFVLKSLEKVSE
jgi:hypothetical protein